MRRKRNGDRDIEKVKEKAREEVAPTIERLARVREEHQRLETQMAQMAREWQLIRGEL